MTYIADLKQGVVRQKAEMEPIVKNFSSPPPDKYWQQKYKEDLVKYKHHIASLKTYPILPGNWVDGKEYQDSEIEIKLKEEVVTGGTGGKRTVYASLKQQPMDQEKTIKQECEEMYSQIKKAEERLKTLRVECKHPNTFEGNYSYRVGVINKATICSDCGELINIHDIFQTRQSKK